MDALDNQDVIALACKRRRRSWSQAKKLALLEEAESTSFYSTAKKYDIPASHLFRWRKQFGRDNLVERVPRAASTQDRLDPRTEVEEQLAELHELKELRMAIIAKLSTEVKEKKVGAYSASCAFTNVINATGRIIAIRAELNDRLAGLPEALKPEEAESLTLTREAQREAEKAVYAMVEKYVERKRQGMA
jgi:transposase-like protein